MTRLPGSAAASASPPVALRLRTASRVLEVDWEDGTTSTWAHSTLRQCCRCAGCEALRRGGEPVAAAEDIVVAEVVPYGPGALRFTFSDGHARGIYPFDYLRQLPTYPNPEVNAGIAPDSVP